MRPEIETIGVELEAGLRNAWALRQMLFSALRSAPCWFVGWPCSMHFTPAAETK